MLTTRAVSIIAVLLLLVANALGLLPLASPFEPYLSCGALVLGLVALVAILAAEAAPTITSWPLGDRPYLIVTDEARA